jgi:hypothetical protein
VRRLISCDEYASAAESSLDTLSAASMPVGAYLDLCSERQAKRGRKERRKRSRRPVHGSASLQSLGTKLGSLSRRSSTQPLPSKVVSPPALLEPIPLSSCSSHSLQRCHLVPGAARSLPFTLTSFPPTPPLPTLSTVLPLLPPRRPFKPLFANSLQRTTGDSTATAVNTRSRL